MRKTDRKLDQIILELGVISIRHTTDTKTATANMTALVLYLQKMIHLPASI
jgi:hypothetical protein